jgi:hypothetical protein
MNQPRQKTSTPNPSDLALFRRPADSAQTPRPFNFAPESSYAEFAEAFPNMPESQPTELVVVVPTPATLGVSLWGKGGDNVIILFECNLPDQMVYASNRCD